MAKLKGFKLYVFAENGLEKWAEISESFQLRTNQIAVNGLNVLI